MLLVEPHPETKYRYSRTLSDQFIVSADRVTAAIEELDVRRPRFLVTEVALPTVTALSFAALREPPTRRSPYSS